MKGCEVERLKIYERWNPFDLVTAWLQTVWNDFLVSSLGNWEWLLGASVRMRNIREVGLLRKIWKFLSRIQGNNLGFRYSFESVFQHIQLTFS